MSSKNVALSSTQVLVAQVIVTVVAIALATGFCLLTGTRYITVNNFKITEVTKSQDYFYPHNVKGIVNGKDTMIGVSNQLVFGLSNQKGVCYNMVGFTDKDNKFYITKSIYNFNQSCK